MPVLLAWTAARNQWHMPTPGPGFRGKDDRRALSRRALPRLWCHGFHGRFPLISQLSALSKSGGSCPEGNRLLLLVLPHEAWVRLSAIPHRLEPMGCHKTVVALLRFDG